MRSRRHSGAIEPSRYLRPTRVVQSARFAAGPARAAEVRVSDALILARILAFEGSTYSNDPADFGGATKYGVTQRAYAAWVGHPVSPADIQALTREQAEAFYRSVHLRPFDLLSDPLRLQVIDHGVHRGTRTAIVELQKIVGTPLDGWLGQQTIGAIATLGTTVVNNLQVGSRLAHFEDLIADHPTQAKWRKGWRARALTFYVVPT